MQLRDSELLISKIDVPDLMTEVVSGMKETFRDQVNTGFTKLMTSMTEAIDPNDNHETATEKIRSLQDIQEEINENLTEAISFIKIQRKIKRGTYMWWQNNSRSWIVLKV